MREPLQLTDAATLADCEPGWWVYLFALTDCSAFKVGFSCNPLQRIHSFSRCHCDVPLFLDDPAAARGVLAACEQAYL